MPDPSAIDSWPAAAVALAILLTLQIPGLVSTMRTRRDTRVIRAQTENDHSDHPHPNLRSQLDAIHADVRAMQDEQAAVRAELTGHVEQADAWQAVVEGELATLSRPWWRRQR